MFDDHEPYQLSDFNGLWARGEDEIVPRDHFIVCRNTKFKPGGFGHRDGFDLDASVGGVRRYFNFRIPGQAARKIILTGGGNLYDSLNIGTPILTIPNMSDFSMSVWGTRAYISPHDRVRGLAGQKVYVYDGVTIRPAGGQPPSGFTLTATTTANSGKVEAGDHLFAIAYETESGYITKPGPDIFAKYTAPGGATVLIGNISVGPAGTIARHILASKKLPTNYNGNQSEIELFFVEDGLIDDNFNTTKEVSFFDADLLRSADYLSEQLVEIPAALGVGAYKSQFIAWNTQTHENLIYVSRPNEPESISEVDGYIEIKDDEKKQGIRACVEYRQQLYICKPTRTYVTEATEDAAAFWQFSGIDRGIGTEVFGIAKIVDVEGSTTDLFALLDRSGARAYIGNFQTELTYKIRALWKRVNKQYLSTAQFYIDAVNSRIYINVPLDASTSPNVLLYGDFSEGLDPLKIKWSTWDFLFSPTSITLDMDDTNIPFLEIGSINDNIYRFEEGRTNDNNFAFTWEVQFAYLGPTDGSSQHFGGVTVRAKGAAILKPSLLALDDNNYDTQVILPDWVVVPKPRSYYAQQTNMVAPQASLRLRTEFVDEFVTITQVALYANGIWDNGVRIG